MTDVHVAHNLNECFICGAEKNFHTKLCMFTVPDTHSAEKNFHTKLCMFTVPDTHSAEKTFTQNVACSQCQIHTVQKKLSHKTLRVHSARYTQCIHVSSRKLKLPRNLYQ